MTYAKYVYGTNIGGLVTVQIKAQTITGKPCAYNLRIGRLTFLVTDGTGGHRLPKRLYFVVFKDISIAVFVTDNLPMSTSYM